MGADDEHRASAFPLRVGERLRAARETQDLALAEVAARTRVPMRHLRMIEDGEYVGLPAATYSAGFVKAYARLLGLDGQDLSAAFRAEMGRTVERPSRPAPYEPADPRRTPPLGVAIAALLVAAVLALAYLYWRGSTDQPVAIAADGVAQPPPAAAMPSAAAPAPATAPVASGGPVAIGATQDVWIKVAAGGGTLFMGLMKPGDHFTVPADAIDPLLTTGRPGVTTIMVGATPIPAVGDPDRAARNISLKPDALLARVATPPPGAPIPVTPIPVTNVAGPG